MLNTDTQRVVATMCFAHSRYPGNVQAINSLKGKVATLYLCLNGFSETPPELQQDWIEIMHSGSSLGDVDVKCLQLLRDKGEVNAHVLVCNDNVIYPPSYVRNFLILHEKYPGALLTYHGYDAYYPEPNAILYDIIMDFNFRKSITQFRHMDVPGAGVSFIPESVFMQMRFDGRPCLDQASVHLACNCLRLNVPIVGIPHNQRHFETIHHSKMGDWISLHWKTWKPDFMSEVCQTYQSYGLNLATLYSNYQATLDKFKSGSEFKVTTILNHYKRAPYLTEQIEALRAQTVPTDIWIDYTVVEGEEMMDISGIAPEAKLTVRVNQNLYHIGRFYYALNAPTEYVFILDDDIIPGKNYIRHCIDTMERIGDCVLTAYGVLFKSGVRSYVPNEASRSTHGWNKGLNQMQKDPIRVDMAGHSWFMKKKHLACIAYEDPPSRLTGEDLHFSYCLQKYAGIPLYVPPHIAGEYDNWSCLYEKGSKYNVDNNASANKPGFYPMRSWMVAYYVDRGWEFVDDDKNSDLPDRV